MTDKIQNILRRPDASLRLLPWQTVLLCALSALISAVACSLLGSGVLLCVSGVIFAFALCADGSPAVWAAAPAAYLLAFMLSGNPVQSLTSLLFAVFGSVTALCIKTKKRLSVTVTALTVAAALCVGLLLCAQISELYGAGLVEGFKTYAVEVSSSFDSILFDELGSLTDENGVAVFSSNLLKELKEILVMTVPAVIVIVLEALAYGSAKLFLLLTVIFGRRSMLIEKKWRLTVSLPTYILFVAAYIVCMFSSSLNVVYYSAANLMYIVMPFTAISGIHSMFGKDSAFRRSQRTGVRVFTIIMCALFFFMSPIMLPAAFGFWGMFDSLRRTLAERRNNGGNHGGDI